MYYLVHLGLTFFAYRQLVCNTTHECVVPKVQGRRTRPSSTALFVVSLRNSKPACPFVHIRKPLQNAVPCLVHSIGQGGTVVKTQEDDQKKRTPELFFILAQELRRYTTRHPGGRIPLVLALEYIMIRKTGRNPTSSLQAHCRCG